ncbi:hypothetical protein IOQ59_05815 [Pontibacterium sp. N1Y112]|uniref:Uncharacterized protein n=1 Tax=Pontibacterium sinense TaxID=2781979 RepID=A0A8J7FIL5_9GAMM|nr:hypothetical protein [Pontibacterium sinense]MBE9396778.1 hypothetical protein [Pontibacterium sinense]
MPGLFSAVLAFGLLIYSEEYGALIGLISLFLVGGMLHGMVQRYIILQTDQDDPLFEAARSARAKMMWGLRVLAIYGIYVTYSDYSRAELMEHLGMYFN